MSEEVPYGVEPEVAGRAAFYSGRSNPYPESHPHHARWAAGYRLAVESEARRSEQRNSDVPPETTESG